MNTSKYILILLTAFKIPATPVYGDDSNSGLFSWFHAFTKLFTVKHEDSRYLDISASHLIIAFGEGVVLSDYKLTSGVIAQSIPKNSSNKKVTLLDLKQEWSDKGIFPIEITVRLKDLKTGRNSSYRIHRTVTSENNLGVTDIEFVDGYNFKYELIQSSVPEQEKSYYFRDHIEKYTSGYLYFDGIVDVCDNTY